MKALISACIITDRPMLKTLETVALWVDEIVVVSSNRKVFDDLCAYAESSTQRPTPDGLNADLRAYRETDTGLLWVLKYREWDNDFSAARNLSILLAHCPWILYIDSDEWVIFDRGTPEQLRQHLETTTDDAFLVRSGFDAEGRSRYCRRCRRFADFRWAHVAVRFCSCLGFVQKNLA